MPENIGSPLTEEERKRVQRMLSDPTSFPVVFPAWIKSRMEADPPLLPISQIVGFAQFTTQVASTIITIESTTSTTYTDLATVGPSLADLADGKYIALFGSMGKGDIAGIGALMSVSVNGGTAVDDDSALVTSLEWNSMMRAVQVTLDNGGTNTLRAKYRMLGTGGTASFQRRWLIATKTSNL